jgi:hypothetical protein
MFSDIDAKSFKKQSKAVVKDATEKASKRRKKFMKQHQDILSSDWTFVSALATPMSIKTPAPGAKSTKKRKLTPVCNNCPNFILDQNTISCTKMLQQWLDMVTGLALEQDCIGYAMKDFKVDHEYRNLLTRLIGFLLISPAILPLHRELFNLHQSERKQKIEEHNYKAIVGPLDVRRISVEHPTMEDVTAMEPGSKGDPDRTHLGSVETAILWNKTQLDVLQGDIKKVFFSSDFSTGKTLLLKTKALALANKLREQKENKGILVNQKWPGGKEDHMKMLAKKSGKQLEEAEEVFFVSFAAVLYRKVRFINSIYSFQMQSFAKIFVFKPRTETAHLGTVIEL